MQLELTLPAREKRSRACTSWATMRDLPVGMSDTGLPVSPHLAENLSAVFAATQIISETVATLPATVYQKIGDGVREARPSHPVAKVLAYPNDNQTCPGIFRDHDRPLPSQRQRLRQDRPQWCGSAGRAYPLCIPIWSPSLSSPAPAALSMT